MNGRFFSWILTAGVGAFFAVAASVKLLDPESFLSALLTYEVFPYRVAVILAVFAPILEALVALSLITGAFRRGGVLLATAMLFFFIVLIGQGLWRGLEMDCGCFGSTELQTTADYFLKIGQNLLLLLALAVARFFKKAAVEEP